MKSEEKLLKEMGISSWTLKKNLPKFFLNLTKFEADPSKTENCPQSDRQTDAT